MEKNPLVSVIVPAYNAEDYIREAVDSALAQTYKNIEIIVVDDGSTDGTRESLAPYINSNRIVYVVQKNEGLASARNIGIKRARGEYIALLDADDIYLPEKIERQVQYLEKNRDCDVCYCDLYHFWDGEPEKLLKLGYRYYSGSEVLPNLVKRNFIAPLTMMIRRSVFERFGFYDPHFRRSEDLEFLVRILSRGANICFLNQILAKLRLRREGNLQDFRSQPEVKSTTLIIFEDLYKKSSSADRKRLELKKYLALYRLKVGLAYLENGDKKSAKKFIADSFRDFFGGKLLGVALWFFLSLAPADFLAKTIRFRHLKTQKSFLKEL